MIEITIQNNFIISLAQTDKHLQLMTTYNNYHCRAHLLADLIIIPLMYNLLPWNNFLKKNKSLFKDHKINVIQN